MLRQFGQGSLSLVSKNVINLWWVRRRGRMMGIVGVFGALLGGLFPYLINTLIAAYGWRWTYVILGVMVLVVMIPVGWIFTRNRPEDHGLEPDGGVLQAGHGTQRNRWRRTGLWHRSYAAPHSGSPLSVCRR
jgi:MFS family permease